MPKKPENEDQAWILAYSIAASLLTLGRSIHTGLAGSAEDFANGVDLRASLIADTAVERMKRKKVI